jgi:hypothetical protein
MLELFVICVPVVAAGFGAGYFVRDCMSWRRHREAARRRDYGSRGAGRAAAVLREGTFPLPPGAPGERASAGPAGWPKSAAQPA